MHLLICVFIGNILYSQMSKLFEKKNQNKSGICGIRTEGT